jgi:3-hydroxyisobutyrate dehydrogenase-like beta-hydroxyacid dehydrogenase
MGLPMIRHLVPLGYAVRAYDVVPEKVSAAAAAGAAAASSPAEVVAGADLVLLNLPTVAAVEQAVFADRGVASAMRAPQLVVDFSTIPVEKCRAFGARLRADTGCGWIDAPVSGGRRPRAAARSPSWQEARTPTSRARGRSLMMSPAASRTWARPPRAWPPRCSISSSSASGTS